MTTRWRLTLAASLVPLVLAGCAGAPGGELEPVQADGTPGARPVPSGPGTAPVVAAPTTAAPGTAPSAPGTFVPRFPGDVAPGAVRWGAAIGGNGDPARHEAVTGVPLGVRRTYFSWEKRTGSMVRTAAADLAAGRLPWVSVKTPGWVGMANGTYDAQIDEMLRALDQLGGPVWLTVHHEPEGGNGTPYPDEGAGTEGNWRAMQIRVRQRMTALGTRNIAFAPILMAWTYDPASKRNPADWWVDGIWDFVGIDHYVKAESTTSMEVKMWNNTRAFIGAKGLKIAVGEWGNKGVDAAAAEEMRAFYRMAISPPPPGQSQVIGLAYFDSNLNSTTGGWELFGEPLAAFRQLMAAPTSLSARESS